MGRQQGRPRGGPRGPGRGGHGGRGGKRQAVEDSSSRQDRMQPAAHPGQSQQATPAISAAPTPPLTEAVPQDTPRFADLAGSGTVHPTIIQTITEDLKFDHMMPVQAATLHELLPPRRSDCLVQAKTGTGKTVAFLLPALQNLVSQRRAPDSPISLLVISPTRELAMQIAKEAHALLQRLTKYRTCIAIGGTNKDREERQILSGCDILIATPGRLLDHMSNENVKWALRQVDTLVLDEADRLLDMGFMNDLKKIVAGLPDKVSTNRQGMLFSATIAPHVEQVAGLVLGPGYKFISTIPEGEANTHQRVPQILVQVPTFDLVAPAMVGSVCQEAKVVGAESFKAIIFAPTAALADFYGHVLSELGGFPPVSVLHARISQNKRTKVTNDYRTARSAILVATDVVARGMDFPGVTTVFQVGLPADKQSYIHRLGRTARAGAEGRGILVVADAEHFFPRWTLKDITLVPHEADLSSASQVADITARMPDADKAKVYQAWLGYYKNYLKALKWDNVELVAQGNLFARTGLGAAETPGIAKSTIGKMGLKGTKGLKVVPDPPKQGQGRGRGGGGGGGGQGKRGGRA